jgi:hypothetical protein
VGLIVKKFQAPAGAAENKQTVLSVAPAGLVCFFVFYPRFHRGLFSAALPALNFAAMRTLDKDGHAK